LVGGIMQYQPGGIWVAYDARYGNETTESLFWHRRDAKRWVEALP